MKSVLSSLPDSLRPQARRRPSHDGYHQSSAEVPSSLPTVRGDAERLRQLVDNLLSNAIKYSDSGGEVRVDARSDDGHVVISVADRGPGISPEHQGQIFEKFGRGRDASGKQRPGAGLGLYLSRQIVQAHGSELTAKSGPDDGAVFAFDLRVAP